MMDEELLYLEDERLYAFWRLLNNERFLGRDKTYLTDFSVPGESVNLTINSLFFELTLMRLSLDGLAFNKEFYKKDHPDAFKALLEHIKNEQTATQSISLVDILSGDFTIDDVATACLFPSFKLTERIEFNTVLPKKTKSVLKKFLDNYIESFINDGLEVDTINYFKFEKQKKLFFKDIQSHIESFGSTFVYKTPEQVPFGSKSDYELAHLFIHTLIALEKLDYLAIENIWVYDYGLLSEQDQTVNYKVKMTITEKLREEMRSTFGDQVKKVDNLSGTATMLSFDPKESKLSFKGKEIEIAKSRNTNPHYLLETIFKDKNKVWSYDEIAEDWEHDYEKDDWKRYYYAAYSVNEKVEKKTGVNDFLDITNKSVRVKEEYL